MFGSVESIGSSSGIQLKDDAIGGERKRVSRPRPSLLVAFEMLCLRHVSKSR